MSEEQGTLFTIGEFAAKAGVTLKTLKYYDKIGLFKPCLYSDCGYADLWIKNFNKGYWILPGKKIY